MYQKTDHSNQEEQSSLCQNMDPYDHEAVIRMKYGEARGGDKIYKKWSQFSKKSYHFQQRFIKMSNQNSFRINQIFKRGAVCHDLFLQKHK